MPIIGGYDAAKAIRVLESKAGPPTTPFLNGRLPILAVSASLHERQRPTLLEAGIDGWILKPIDFKRLNVLMRGSLDNSRRNLDVYRPGFWEKGGWLEGAK